MLRDSIFRTKVYKPSRLDNILSAWPKIPVSAARKLVIRGVLISSGLLAYWYLKGHQRNEDTHQRPMASKIVQDAKFRLATECHYLTTREADERLRAHEERFTFGPFTTTKSLELNEVYSAEPPPDAESLRQAIRRGFGTASNHRMTTLLRSRQGSAQHTALDSQITPAPAPLPAAHKAKEETSQHKAPELHTAAPPLFPGAAHDSKGETTHRCALLLVYDHQDRVLHVASTGGPYLLRNSPLLGTLGLLWGQKSLPGAHKSDDNTLTIPRPTILQLTPEPLVTSVEVEPGSGCFVVMASGRLWECLSAVEVVALVGRWMDEPKNTGTEEGLKGWTKYINSVGLTTVSNRALTGQGRLSQRTLNFTSPDERFVLEDGNAASHLIRNALGGRLQSQPLSAWLRFSLLLGRGYPADMTTSVVFFGVKPPDVGERFRGLAKLAYQCRVLIARLAVDITIRSAELAQALAPV
ncbi:hypothetical protein BO82DRAFT_394433 [Aspergillus uvarum CBS 121591]|uniref:PPM-type phosphatase domain-containing protein n=1 Tax=Aspergillus uvarum CBS 121591 TaxID=1448315 RepID=A0A319BYE1_9EURO|nr:hypothetical protein BO82DRAFT_394433 [Aspergillus uvarum CBS 121591]PYH78736.1 hypothetical protein BO82DRAFT_394433 [Aspergillus uvarum CBS 121591]